MQNARNNFMLLIFMFIFICQLFKKKKIIRNSSLPSSSSILHIFMFMFICRLSKKKKKNCKELELGELEYLRKTIRSILFTKNSSSVCSTSILQGTRVYQARVPHFFFYCTNSRSAVSWWNENRNSSTV